MRETKMQSELVRDAVLRRDDFTCQMCGCNRGDRSPYTGRKIILTTDGSPKWRPDGEMDDRYVRTVCMDCAEGKAGVRMLPKPSRIELLRQVRRATIDDQLHLLEWLETKYAKIRPKR
jgi:hypothetical protein